MKKKQKKTGKADDHDPEEVAHQEARDDVEESAAQETATPESPEQQRDRLSDQLKRAMADLQNIRKRHRGEMDDARRRAIEGLTSELLPVLDNFHLALAAHEQQDQGDEHAMVEGVRMVRSLLQGVLERHGLAEIPALGVAFDPNVHEAVGMDDVAGVEAGHVARVMQIGYTMGERVIRPTKVIVAGRIQGDAAADEPRGTRRPEDGAE